MLERLVELATETIAEKQARLDAIAEMYRVSGDETTRQTFILASGRPARECARLVKKWGKR